MKRRTNRWKRTNRSGVGSSFGSRQDIVQARAEDLCQGERDNDTEAVVEDTRSTAKVRGSKTIGPTFSQDTATNTESDRTL